MKRCWSCGKTKELDLFYKNKTRKDGYSYECKDCTKIFHKNYRKQERCRIEGLRRAKKYRDRNRDSIRNQRYKKQYGISFDDKIKILKLQKCKCIICNKKIDGVSGHLDHCHKTKKIRGILCGNCNTAIGLFQDNIKLLESAIKYLRR